MDTDITHRQLVAPAASDRIYGVLRSFWRWLSDADYRESRLPLSITQAKRVKVKHADLSRLYILRVDFPVDEIQAGKIDAALDAHREKYGIDFIVLEPGMTLTRFDDI